MGAPAAGICCRLVAALIRYVDPRTATSHTAGFVKPNKADPTAKIQVRDRGFLPILVKAAAVGFDKTQYRLRRGVHTGLISGNFPVVLTALCMVIVPISFATITVRTSVHGAGMIQYQHSCCGTGFLLRFSLLQDDFQLDFVLVRVRGRFRGLGDRFNASRQRALVEGSLFPGRTFIVAIFDVATRTCNGSLPLSSQRYRREQADGQDQRQQQGYDSFHHFFFSPYVWFNFFVFFFRFSMCNGRGAGV